MRLTIECMAQNLILGTAGHIDHGKTSLIRALTGTNTDRLPEEKKRGITIELGYASLQLDDYDFGIVDVPGHEKFVRQMLAGATGMDIAMLVIAADDSVKPQTVEHLDILRMLNLEHGLIALTKCDIADPDWIELVEDEVREFVKGTFLEDSRIIRTSSHTGLGVDELKAELQALAAKVLAGRNEESAAPFRMAIDRVFTIAGHGTVVTGSVNSGEVAVGDQLEIQPGDVEVRVRGIQNHDQSVDSIARGQRGAINIAGIHHNDLQRGQELAANKLLNASRSMIVDFTMLPEQIRPLLDRQRIRFHVGTAEIMGFVRILSQPEEETGKRVGPGQKSILQVFLSEPAVTVWNQPFVLRSESPVQTIGGGRVIHPFSPRINRKNRTQIEAAEKLTDKDVVTRVDALIYLSPIGQWNPNDLAASAGAVDLEPIFSRLTEQGTLLKIELPSNRSVLVHSLHIDELGETIKQKLNRFHDENPLGSGLDRKQIASGFQYLPQLEIVKTAIDRLVENGDLEKRQLLLGLSGRGPQLSKNEQNLLAQIVESFRSAGIHSPSVDDLKKQAKKGKDSIPSLIELAVGRGDLAKIADDYFVHQQTIDETCAKLRGLLEQQAGATMSEIRQTLDISRKYAVPLCEYLDKINFTNRRDDKRFLADSTNQP